MAAFLSAPYVAAGRRPAAGLEDVEEVGHPGLRRAVPADGIRADAGVGDRSGDLAAYDVGRVEQEHEPVRLVGLAHLRVGSRRSITRAPTGGVATRGR